MEEKRQLYPHLSDEQAQTLKDIDASDSQWKASDASAKKTIDRILANYRHDTGKPLVILVTGATGAGKSATANTLLGRKAFEEGSAAVSVTTKVQANSVEVDGIEVVVVDTPGSWETQIGTINVPGVDIYILVINLASPRFGQQQLNELRTLRGSEGQPLLRCCRCLVVLSHADSALQQTTLTGYLDEIQGDPLHTFLTTDLQGNFLAVNNTAGTEYERGKHQRAILSMSMNVQKGKKSGSPLSILKSGLRSVWMILMRHRRVSGGLIGIMLLVMVAKFGYGYSMFGGVPALND